MVAHVMTTAVLLLALILPKTAAAVPPMPARIGGTVTIDGSVLSQGTDSGYTFFVQRGDGAAFVPAASDIDGLNASDWYLIDIPMVDASEQPGGAQSGDTVVVRVYADGVSLQVTEPPNGTFTVGDSGSTTRIDIEALSSDPGEIDSDGDGVVDSQDGCPDDFNKADPGECGCGVSDVDSDGDGVPDCNDHYPGDSSRWNADDESGSQEQQGFPPLPPVAVHPQSGMPNVSISPQLSLLEDFQDPDEADTHASTRWQISRDEFFQMLVMDITTPSQLYAVAVPDLILEPDETYFWRATFLDSRQVSSEWSEPFWFVTSAANEDVAPANGVPDSQEVDDTVDLDQDGVPDIYQVDLKSVEMISGEVLFGVKISSNVVAIDALRAMDPASLGVDGNMPGVMGFGMIGFKIRVADSDKPAVVIVYMSEGAPENSKWYKYDLRDGWQDYTDAITFSADRSSFSLKLEDGGAGDADGTANGIIVDPGGIVFLEERDQPDDAPAAVPSGGGSGGGCFVSGLLSGFSRDVELF